VVLLGRPEDFSRLALGVDHLALGQLLAQCSEQALRLTSLCGGVCVDAMAILGADVKADLITKRRVYGLQQLVAQRAEGHLGRVVQDLACFRVTAATATHLVVCRTLILALCVTDAGRDDALYALKV